MENIVGVLSVILALFLYRNLGIQSNAGLYDKLCEGEIVKLLLSEKRPDAVKKNFALVKYVIDEVEYYIRTNTPNSKYELGMKMLVEYNSEDPQISKSGALSKNDLILGVNAVLILVLFFGGIWLLIKSNIH